MIVRAAICLLLFAAFGQADTYVRQPSVDVIRYEISIELTDDSNSIAGTTRIHVLMRGENVSGMWLDLADMRVDKLIVEGVERPFTHRNGRLSFDFGRNCSRNETAVVEVHYHGRPGKNALMIRKNQYGRRVFFTDNWPDRARRWFPSIDHPSDKAAVDVTVVAPAQYDVVSNGRLAKGQLLPDGRKLTRWIEDKDIPTYCVAIGAAEFTIAHQAGSGAAPLAWYSFPPDAERAAKKFSRTALALQLFGSLIAPYPYEKLAQVQSIIPLGGMENASAIFYSEASFKGDTVSEYPVPHEIAHQWFGDSVTEADWDHLWLSEGFATYFEALFYESLQGPELMRRIMAAGAKRLEEYKPARSAAILDPLATDPRKKLNPINYEKGAWILHMLRGILGDEKFFDGVRRYYLRHAGGNVLSDDFRKAMESSSGVDLGVFFQQWLTRPGWPVYRIACRWDQNAGQMDCMVRQVQASGLFDMPLEIAFSAEDWSEVHQFRIAERTQKFRIPLPSKPLSIEADPGGWVLKSATVAFE